MMTLVLRRDALSIGVASAMLAACGGSQPPIAAPGAIPQTSLLAAPAGRECRVPNDWYFHGACVSHELPASGWTYNLAAYRGYALAVTIPKNDGNGTAVFDVSDATGNGDITGKYNGATFPPYGPTCYHRVGRKGKCPGKVFFYLHMAGNNQQVITLTGVPTATLTSESGFPGSRCFPAHLHRTPYANEWWPNVGLSKVPKGDRLSLKLSNVDQYWGHSFHINANAVHAFACE